VALVALVRLDALVVLDARPRILLWDSTCSRGLGWVLSTPSPWRDLVACEGQARARRARWRGAATQGEVLCVDDPVVRGAQQDRVVDVGRAEVAAPPRDVVDLAPARGDLAARKGTVAIPGDHESTLGAGPQALGAAEVDGDGLRVKDDAGDGGVAQDARGLARGNGGAVLEGRRAEGLGRAVDGLRRVGVISAALAVREVQRAKAGEGVLGDDERDVRGHVSARLRARVAQRALREGVEGVRGALRGVTVVVAARDRRHGLEREAQTVPGHAVESTLESRAARGVRKREEAGASLSLVVGLEPRRIEARGPCLGGAREAGRVEMLR